MFEAYLNQ
jgi:renalase